MATCLNPTADVSYHVLIEEDGSSAVQLVRWERKAWHAKVHNSRSEGISLAGFASSTKALTPGGRVFARVVAARLKARGLPPIWRRHGEVGGGVCRHADLQTDRHDPMIVARWTTFVALVKYEYHRGEYRERWGFGEPDEIGPET
jgi:N-acetyl-anhydromuramyl-L-alanine amidase AmpD